MSDGSSDANDSPSLVDQAIAEYLSARDAGKPMDRALFLARYGQVRRELEQFLENDLDALGVLGNGKTPNLLPLEMTTEFISSSPFQDAPKRARLVPSATAESLPKYIGSYELVALLGEGGMGRVYEARDSTGQPVAVKILGPAWAKTPESMQRFKQEGALASTINHPRCVFVRAVDEIDGHPLIVMELMSGLTLRDLVAKSGPLAVNDAISKILDVIEGLQQAHHRGMIHRDIKPANCFLEPSGRVKVGDFGLARSVESDSELTQTGSFIGTPLFASPEQVRGEKLDLRTDVYSVCATLYYLLTGQAPFANYSATQVIARIVSEDPTPLCVHNPSLPRLLEKLVQKGLNRNPEKRFQDLEELRVALEPFVRGKQAIAQVAKRLAAYGFDTGLLTIVLYATGILLRGNLAEFSKPTVQSLLVAWSVLWVYYMVFEAVWGATLGKMALRLMVVDSVSGERASPIRIVVRVLVYFFVGSQLIDLVAYWMLPPDSFDKWAFAIWAGHGLGLVALCTTLLTHSGARMLHDVLSGTMVVARHQTSARTRLVQQAGKWHPSLISPVAWPSQLGSYRPMGVIWQSAEEGLLLAEDNRLPRSVWLHVYRGESRYLSQTRMQCSRTSRLRWLSNGRTDDCGWNAFVAPEGAPLRYWVTPKVAFSWEETRGIIEQLVEELRCSRTDGFPTDIRSIDQVWLNTHGRLTLVDWSLDGEQSQSIASTVRSVVVDSSKSSTSIESTGFTRKEMALVRETMRLCLKGSSEPIDDSSTPVRAVIPLHARSIVSKFEAANLNGITPEQALAELAESSNRPASITALSRLASIGISCVSLLLITSAMISLTRVGNQIGLMQLSGIMLHSAAVQASVSDSKLWDAWTNSKSPPELPGVSSQDLRDRLREAATEYRAKSIPAFDERFRAAGLVQKQVMEFGGVQADFADRVETMKFELVDPDTFQLKVIGFNPAGNESMVTGQDLNETMSKVPETHLPKLLRRPSYFITAIGQLPLLAMCVWAGLSYGGLPFLLTGIRVVRRDGRMAPWWLMILRTLLLWSPIILLNIIVITIDVNAPSLGWLALILHLTMLLTLISFAAIALAWPNRGPHDWLLGTYLVPK